MAVLASLPADQALALIFLASLSVVGALWGAGNLADHVRAVRGVR